MSMRTSSDVPIALKEVSTAGSSGMWLNPSTLEAETEGSLWDRYQSDLQTEFQGNHIVM